MLGMPVQSAFLVAPDDWLCIDDLGQSGNDSILRAGAFDVLESELLVGSLMTDGSNTNRSDAFWSDGNLLVSRLPARFDDGNDLAALGVALNEPLDDLEGDDELESGVPVTPHRKR